MSPLNFDPTLIYEDLKQADRKSLYSKYRACNNQTFVDSLRQSGATMVQVESVFYAILMRMMVVGLDHPTDCIMGSWESFSREAMDLSPDMA